MAISDEITRLQSAKSALKTSIEGKGVTVPSSAKLEDYPALVDSIEAGGGGSINLTKEMLTSIDLYILNSSTAWTLDQSNNFDGGYQVINARAIYKIVYNFTNISITVNQNWTQGIGFSTCAQTNAKTTLLEVGQTRFDYLWNTTDFTVYLYLNDELIGKVIADDD